MLNTLFKKIRRWWRNWRCKLDISYGLRELNICDKVLVGEDNWTYWQAHPMEDILEACKKLHLDVKTFYDIPEKTIVHMSSDVLKVFQGVNWEDDKFAENLDLYKVYNDTNICIVQSKKDKSKGYTIRPLDYANSIDLLKKCHFTVERKHLSNIYFQ